MDNKVIAVTAVSVAAAMTMAGCGATATLPLGDTNYAVGATSESGTPEAAVALRNEDSELYLSTETVTYQGSKETVITTHRYNDRGLEVYTRKQDEAVGVDITTTTEYDDAGHVAKTTMYDKDTKVSEAAYTYDPHGNVLTVTYDDTSSGRYEYSYDDFGRISKETFFVLNQSGEHESYTTAYTYDGSHELPVLETTISVDGVDVVARDFDSLAKSNEYLEILVDVSGSESVYHKRVEDDQTTYYKQGDTEVQFEYDQYGNITKQYGHDADMGDFEQSYANEYDEDYHLVAVRTAFNGADSTRTAYSYAPFAQVLE